MENNKMIPFKMMVCVYFHLGRKINKIQPKSTKELAKEKIDEGFMVDWGLRVRVLENLHKFIFYTIDSERIIKLDRR